jgi:Leu/Phe-tRNA-protein transferase
MKAGFLVMSAAFPVKDQNLGLADHSIDLVLPKLHLERSALFFDNLHIKRSIFPVLPRYKLCFDTDFETVVQKCLQIHGDIWLTPSLIKCIFKIREQAAKMPILSTAFFPKPVSFSLYRDGQLKAGEFGIICGRVYTSYSGYKEEDNSGTVQMILMAKALEKAGFSFLDFGMPLDYKTDLGAINISPEQFVDIFRSAQIEQG